MIVDVMELDKVQDESVTGAVALFIALSCSHIDGVLEEFTLHWVKPLNGSLSKHLALT